MCKLCRQYLSIYLYTSTSFQLCISTSIHIEIYLYVYLSLHFFIYLSIHLYIYKSIHAYQHLSIHPYIYLYISTSICTYLQLDIYTFIYTSIYLYISTSIHLSICTPIYLYGKEDGDTRSVKQRTPCRMEGKSLCHKTFPVKACFPQDLQLRWKPQCKVTFADTGSRYEVQRSGSTWQLVKTNMK